MRPHRNYRSILDVADRARELHRLSQILKAENADELLKDLAILGTCKSAIGQVQRADGSPAVSERGVVFFRGQDIGPDGEQTLISKLGELSGKPKDSHLHVHPYLTVEPGDKGDFISEINSDRRAEYFRGDRSRLASTGWHSDITFERVPSDYAVLKVRIPACLGSSHSLTIPSSDPHDPSDRW